MNLDYSILKREKAVKLDWRCAVFVSLYAKEKDFKCSFHHNVIINL